jgi:hypothetical protein
MGKSKDLATRVGIDDNADATAITINNSENVGIGTTSPSSKLTLKAANNGYTGGLRIEGVDETTALAITHVNGDNYFSGNATNDHLILSSSGHVTMPSQPMFHAYNSTNDTFTTTEAKHNFNSTRINVGSHFNTSLSRFVAPTNGYYFFTWGGTITITANDPYITAYLRKNGASPGGMRTRANSTSGSGYRYWGAAGAEVQYMAANDYMEVYHYSQNGNASSASPEYIFTGFLIG